MPKSREKLIVMRMKPQDYPIERAGPAEYSKCCRSSRYTLRKARRLRFCNTFPRNWMTGTCTGSREVQELWQTEAIFQHLKNHNADSVFQRFRKLSFNFQFNDLFFR